MSLRFFKLSRFDKVYKFYFIWRLTWYGLVGLGLCKHPTDRIGFFQTGSTLLWRSLVHLGMSHIDIIASVLKSHESRETQNLQHQNYLFLGNISFRDVNLLRHPKEIVHPEFSSIGASYNVWRVSRLKSQSSWQIHRVWLNLQPLQAICCLL